MTKCNHLYILSDTKIIREEYPVVFASTYTCDRCEDEVRVRIDETQLDDFYNDNPHFFNSRCDSLESLRSPCGMNTAFGDGRWK